MFECARSPGATNPFSDRFPVPSASPKIVGPPVWITFSISPMMTTFFFICLEPMLSIDICFAGSYLGLFILILEVCSVIM